MSAKKGYARISYVSKKDHKLKFLQTAINKHETKEKAMIYLKELKEKKKKEEENELHGTTDKIDKDAIDDIVIDDAIDDPNKNIKTKTDETILNNLMNEQMISTPKLDQIILNLKYSPFRLEVDPHETGSSITLFGSSKSYKTTLLKRILNEYYSEDTITLLCAQNLHAPIYNDLPDDIIKLDCYCAAMVKAMYRINKRTKNKYSFVVVLDDIIDEKNDKDIEKLFLTLRNAKISIITLLQHITLLKSSARSNSNIVIFRKFNQPAVIEQYVMKHYLKNYPPFKDLSMSDAVTLYMRITNTHDFFVLDVLNNTLTVHHDENAN